jgi:RAB protein geranylgeranyltransferase component A
VSNVGLMGLFEKRRFRSFLQFVQELDPEDQKTWKGFNVKTQTMQECYDKHGLDAGTADFTGHALALYLNDEYVLYTQHIYNFVLCIFVNILHYVMLCTLTRHSTLCQHSKSMMILACI